MKIALIVIGLVVVGMVVVYALARGIGRGVGTALVNGTKTASSSPITATGKDLSDDDD